MISSILLYPRDVTNLRRYGERWDGRSEEKNERLKKMRRDRVWQGMKSAGPATSRGNNLSLRRLESRFSSGSSIALVSRAMKSTTLFIERKFRAPARRERPFEILRNFVPIDRATLIAKPRWKTSLSPELSAIFERKLVTLVG